ncbi:SRPBCC domain-containing protein [Nonomuraea sp. NPDC050153]|uniref:SRPBCC domain-containing protein n=1 Tax=Nonomuraea sp. NPDC050153 TaxID=3364359 RepID=UPI0037906268
MNDRKRPIVELTINAPQDAVWRAVSTPEGLHEWFGYDYDPSHTGPARPAAGLADEIRSFIDDSELQPPERVAFDDGTELTLTADGTRTVVRLVVPDVEGASWKDLYGGVAEGWRFYLEQLRFYLDRAPSGRRRTVYLAGQATGAQVTEIVGPGTPWHEASIVNDEGHLISVGADPADPQPAQVNVIVNTYGLDDDAFAALRDQWTARWQATVKDPEVIP